MSQLNFFWHMDIHICQAGPFTAVSLADRQVPLEQSFDAAATCFPVFTLCYSYYNSVVKRSDHDTTGSPQSPGYIALLQRQAHCQIKHSSPT